MRTLIINTYAGSLLLGANAIPGANIIGSYEDSGFGVANTKANRSRFQNLDPNFQFVDQRKNWPEQDLTDTVILAHPPCSAFSQQGGGASQEKRGINSSAFECTRTVLKYGMTNNAAAIAIESVPGALRGAWDVYDEMSERGGYYVYRILKNSICFGVPQYRERFWAVLVRKKLAPDAMIWRLSPKFTTIGATLDGLLPHTPIPSLYRGADRFVEYLTTGPCRCGAVHGFDEAEVRRIGFGDSDGYMRRGFAGLIQPKFFPNLTKGEVCKYHVSPFTSCQPSTLAIGGFSNVLLSTAFWVYRGQPVSEEGYKRIMGFPIDYIFPRDKNYSLKCYLSKGVCPPVATWILDNIRTHLGEARATPLTRGEGYVRICEPGRVVSFKPSRNAILEKYAAMWEMRSPDDDELIPLGKS